MALRAHADLTAVWVLLQLKLNQLHLVLPEDDEASPVHSMSPAQLQILSEARKETELVLGVLLGSIDTCRLLSSSLPPPENHVE